MDSLFFLPLNGISKSNPSPTVKAGRRSLPGFSLRGACVATVVRPLAKVEKTKPKEQHARGNKEEPPKKPASYGLGGSQGSTTFEVTQ